VSQPVWRNYAPYYSVNEEGRVPYRRPAPATWPAAPGEEPLLGTVTHK
jgi:hypothetical protein